MGELKTLAIIMIAALTGLVALFAFLLFTAYSLSSPKMVNTTRSQTMTSPVQMQAPVKVEKFTQDE